MSSAGGGGWTVSHLWAKFFGVGDQRVRPTRAGQAFVSLTFFRQGRWLGRHVVERGMVVRFVVPVFSFGCIRGFCQREPPPPSSHCSHVRRMSLEETLTVVSASTFHDVGRVSGDIGGRSRPWCRCAKWTPEKAAKRQRTQACSAAFGMCVWRWYPGGKDLLHFSILTPMLGQSTTVRALTYTTQVRSGGSRVFVGNRNHRAEPVSVL